MALPIGAVEFDAFGGPGTSIRLAVVMSEGIAQQASDAVRSTIASVLDGTPQVWLLQERAAVGMNGHPGSDHATTRLALAKTNRVGQRHRAQVLTRRWESAPLSMMAPPKVRPSTVNAQRRGGGPRGGGWGGSGVKVGWIGEPAGLFPRLDDK
ncbi:hypothetical protein [Streptomyces sp. MUSC 14]|uniref:hypothetical protein n=1 Tax=Streptomyces sp. MUSC 14 TaxID=1354889 RepID=UPI0015A5F1B7